MNGWVIGPDGLLFCAAVVLLLAVVLALDYWVIRMASRINGH